MRGWKALSNTVEKICAMRVAMAEPMAPDFGMRIIFKAIFKTAPTDVRRVANQVSSSVMS